MKKYFLHFAIFALGIFIGWFANGQLLMKPEQPQQPIKIGVVGVLSGEAASYGQAVQKGLELAREEINVNNGVLNRNIELIFEDSHLDARIGTDITNKFINVDKLSFLISAEGSGVTSAIAPIAEQSKTLMLITIASTPTLRDAGDYIFRVVPSDAEQGKEMARVANARSYKTAALLIVNDTYGIGIKDVFTERFGGKILGAETFSAGAQDFRTQLLKVKNRNPDVSVLVARKEYPQIFKQIKELEITSHIIASETFKDEEMVKMIGQAAEGVITQFYAETTDYAGYKEKFRQKYGSTPPPYSDYGYDALMVLADAIKRAKNFDPARVKEALYRTGYKGATGKIMFDQYGEVLDKPFTVYQVREGKFVELK